MRTIHASGHDGVAEHAVEPNARRPALEIVLRRDGNSYLSLEAQDFRRLRVWAPSPYPNRPGCRIVVVPTAPGGAPDIAAEAAGSVFFPRQPDNQCLSKTAAGPTAI